jgi:hypothetical protein
VKVASQMTAQRIDEVRAIARSVVQRAVRDAAFAAELRNRPRATLVAAGMAEWALDDFIANDLGIAPEAAGHLAAPCVSVTCNLVSCDAAWERVHPAHGAATEDPLARAQRRVIVKGVIQRALGDPALAARLRADPRATLVDAGLAVDAVDDVIAHELGLPVRVSQYRFEDWDTAPVGPDPGTGGTVETAGDQSDPGTSH